MNPELSGGVAELVDDIKTYFPTRSNDPGFAVYDGKLYFQANGSNSRELFVYDGVSVSLVQDLAAGADSSPSGLTVYDGKLYFSADDGPFGGLYGGELWVFDGTSISLAADILPGKDFDSHPFDLTVYNGRLYFRARDSFDDEELWSFDGTTATLAADIHPVFGSSPRDLTVYDGMLYFFANDGMHGMELWRFDGTTATLAADIVPGPVGIADPLFFQDLTVYDGKLYFSGDDGVHGYELWSFDGTTATLAADIYPGSNSSFPWEFKVYDGTLYFRADEGIHGRELWSYDGMTATLAADINPGPVGSASPFSFFNTQHQLAIYNGQLYLGADDGVQGAELWTFDGSTAALAAAISDGAHGSNPTHFSVYNGQLYFGADGMRRDNLAELWRYTVDPTAPPPPAVLTPVADDAWPLGSDQTIRWTSGSFADESRVIISLTRPGMRNTRLTRTTNTGEWTWQIPQTLAPSTDYSIIIRGFTPEGARLTIESGEFSLIASGAALALARTETLLPLALTLEEAYPNPFSGTTTLRYTLPEATYVSLTLYDMQGRRVAVLVEGPQEAGYHEARLEASSLASGLYLARLQTGSQVVSRRLTLLR